MLIFSSPDFTYVKNLFRHSDELIARSDRVIAQMTHAIELKLCADRMVELQRASMRRMNQAFDEGSVDSE